MNETTQRRSISVVVHTVQTVLLVSALVTVVSVRKPWIGAAQNFHQRKQTTNFTSRQGNKNKTAHKVTDTLPIHNNETLSSRDGASTMGDSEVFEKEVDTSEEWLDNMAHHAGNQTSVIYLNTSEAYDLLVQGYRWKDFSRDFFKLQEGWDAQWNQAFCAVAASAALLNSLVGLTDLPMDPSYNPYPYATQDNMFNECTNANVIHRNETFDGIFVEPYGLGMDQTKEMISCHLSNDSWSVEAYHVDPTVISIEKMRRDLVTALMSPTSRVVINFDRSSVNQHGDGHWSPIGSYSYANDAFLVMDVAKYKYPPAWIPATMLYQSLSTLDSCGYWNFPHAQDALSGKKHHSNVKNILGCQATYRGYIIVKQT
jgi:hypothetical protein